MRLKKIAIYAIIGFTTISLSVGFRFKKSIIPQNILTTQSLIIEENPVALTANSNGNIQILSSDEINKLDPLEYTDYEYVRWEGWKDIKKNGLVSGNLKLAYAYDEVYKSMKLPSEAITFMTYRVNPYIMMYNEPGFTKACSLGAVYPVEGAILPDNININIGKMMIFVLKKGHKTWEILDAQYPLNELKHFQFVTLPWTSGIKYRPEEKLIYHDDYVEFNCPAEEMYGKVFHFYGTKEKCKSDDVIGYVVIYEAWSNTPNVKGTLACTIGADQIGENGTSQVFSGKNYLLTNEKRLIIGHSIPDSIYEQLVKEGKSPEQCIDMYRNYK